jgi:predicted nucleic acid-binding protein
MRLVVLDTNVIVSAGIKPGSAPATLIMDWVLDGQIQVVTSPWIVEEYREVVRRAEFLIDESLRLPDPAAWPLRGPDPKDMPFLALANDSGAWLVTGNLKHFPEILRGDVKVLSPSDYLAHLTAVR